LVHEEINLFRNHSWPLRNYWSGINKPKHIFRTTQVDLNEFILNYKITFFYCLLFCLTLSNYNKKATPDKEVSNKVSSSDPDLYIQSDRKDNAKL